MPIEFRCHQCKKKLRVADAHAGKRAKCPNCQTVLNVPVPEVPEPSVEAYDEFELESPAPSPFSFPAAGKPAIVKPAIVKPAPAAPGQGFDFAGNNAGQVPARMAPVPAPDAEVNPFAISSAGGGMMPGAMSDKSQKTAFLLSCFLGPYGVDRFYVGRPLLGIAKLLTLGCCGLWTLIDLIILGCGAMKDGQGRPLKREIVGTPTRSLGTAFLLSCFLGPLGADRFYLGQTGLGIAKLLTLGGCIFWWAFDIVWIGGGEMKDVDGNSLL